jgi:hypothetical protein
VSRERSFLDKLKEKRNELVRRAAGKAADAALDRTKKAALGAADTVGEAIERAIFGDIDSSKKEEQTPHAPDPFARLKAKEKAEREAAERLEQAEKTEEEVDAELRELKKRLGK